MILEQLKLYNIRCYDQIEFEFNPKFNLIIGLNGQGKTTLLEAIGLLAFLRSFRNARNIEIIKLGQQEANISGQVEHDGLKFRMDVKLWPSRKQATFNGKLCRYLSEYVGKLAAVSFSPLDLEIVRGGPENRRIWVDKLTTIYDPKYIDLLSKYQKILEHRNQLLKAVSEGKLKALPSDFEVWTEELILWGAKVIHKRIHSVDKVVDKIQNYYSKISRQKFDIRIEYFGSFSPQLPYGQVRSDSLELITQALKASLEGCFPKELVLGTTMVGPHRDDIKLMIGDQPIRVFGSQGEIRSLVLAMRLSEAEAYKSVVNISPLLLIDDFSSELDGQRRQFLLDYLQANDSQVFLTTTEDLKLGKKILIDRSKDSKAAQHNIDSKEVIHGNRDVTDGHQQL